MAHFGAYNTSDATTGNTPLGANQTQIVGPFQTDTAQAVAGSVFADQVGTLYVEQSFDGGQHFDISQSFAVTAGTGVSFNVPILAPVVQLRYANGGTAQGTLRLFARTFAQGR